MQSPNEDPSIKAFKQFCHLSARRMQFFAQAVHRHLTGKPMAGEPAGANPLHEATWIEMRMAEIYRESPPDLKHEMAEAEARFRDWPIEKTEMLLSGLLMLLAEIEENRKEVRHG